MIIKSIIFLIVSIFGTVRSVESDKPTRVQTENSGNMQNKKAFFIYPDVMNSTPDLSNQYQTETKHTEPEQ